MLTEALGNRTMRHSLALGNSCLHQRRLHAPLGHVAPCAAAGAKDLSPVGPKDLTWAVYLWSPASFLKPFPSSSASHFSLPCRGGRCPEASFNLHHVPPTRPARFCKQKSTLTIVCSHLDRSLFTPSRHLSWKFQVEAIATYIFNFSLKSFNSTY